MLTFTQHMNRIEGLTAQILLHLQAENYKGAKEDLANIHAHTTAAEQQLDEFQTLKSQGRISPEGFSP